MSDAASAANALLACAHAPASADTVTFARLLGARIASGDPLLLGLSRSELDALIARHFPRTNETVDLPHAVLWSSQWSFVGELRTLLLAHDVTASTHPADAHCLATIIATACLRPDHLWRDLGLSGRDDVTAMLERHYPKLVERNVHALRWKKFLAQEVAFAHGRAPTCAPGCPGCEDYAFCYPDSSR